LKKTDADKVLPKAGLNGPEGTFSQGWGNNSKWRTDLRPDIETEDSFINNQKREI